MKRKLIEHDIPLAETSEASAREKSIHHGHPSTLSIWSAARFRVGEEIEVPGYIIQEDAVSVWIESMYRLRVVIMQRTKRQYPSSFTRAGVIFKNYQ
jgi:hypothetical protein